MTQLTATGLPESGLPAADDESPRRGSALTTSLVISAIAIVFNVGAWIWADGQRINYDDLSLVNIQDSFLTDACCARAGYLGLYLVGMLILGVVALGLALAGAKATEDRPWVAVVAGAMAMFLVMVPVVFLVGHGINHWYPGD